jgi:CSLREA domain-containing protein
MAFALVACGGSSGKPKDRTAPIITLTGVNPQIIEASTAYVEFGATATDNRDGNLSTAIVIDASQVDTQIPGSYVVTYSVTDAAGNSGSAIRTVVVQDTTPPVITLLGDEPQVIVACTPYIELGAEASDTLDGDLSGAIVINAGAVDTTVPSDYTVTYDVADAAGNTAATVTRTVRVELPPPPADFSVNSFTDAVDVNPGDGYCETATPCECTLRAAVMEANALIGDDFIYVPAGIFVRTIPGVNEDAAASGDLDITDNLTIFGSGQRATIIDGAATPTSRNLDRVFHIIGAVHVQMLGMTIQNGSSLGSMPVNRAGGILNEGGSVDLQEITISRNRSGNGGGISNDNGSLTLRHCNVGENTVTAPGGGIWNNGELTVIDSVIEGNQAQAGGGISNYEGSVTITNSTVRDNRAVSAFIDAGGGIANVRGSIVIRNSTLSGNTSEEDGAGISNARSGTVRLSNSTVSGNSAGRNGGAISNYLGSVTVTNSTISGNSAGSQVGGGNSIYTQEGSVILKNTIVEGNTAGDECLHISVGGTITSLGYNYGSDTTCNLTAASDVTNSDPLLGPLADNGGPTRTHALQIGSMAIDAIPAITCDVSSDQRGVPRPQGEACDIGSFELTIN